MKIWKQAVALGLPLVLGAWMLAMGGKTAEPARGTASVPEAGEMTDEELGQLLWAVKIADQKPGDFSNLDGVDQFGMSAYRYQLAFTAYFMAVEQYYRLSACPEILQPRMDRLIAKMIEKPVWDWWAEISVGLPNLEPNFDKPYPEAHDPVGHRNIMYSGHIGHMIGLYETLYHDMKWEKPGSITFAWSPEEKYVYDYKSLNEVMHKQMVENAPHCIECEPNACFPECNQHPILSFMLYDSLHGTNQAAASELFMDFFLEKEFISPRTHDTATLYLVKQDITVSQENPYYQNPIDFVVAPVVKLGLARVSSASADGWTSTFMHVWQKDFIEREYPFQRENNLRSLGEENARLERTAWEPQLKYGFFAMLAAEMGDHETRDKLINFADVRYTQKWEGKTMHYPRSQSRHCEHLTGILIALARAIPRDGLWMMHNHPFTAASFNEPKVTGVDFPNVVLRRAVWNRDTKTLEITAEPGGKNAVKTSLRIVNLDPSAKPEVTIDGREIAGEQADGALVIKAELTGRHRIEVKEI